jgi:type IV pilus assembly protein PilB
MLINDTELSKLVVDLKIVDEKGLEDILSYAKNADLNLADAMVEKEIISEESLAKILSKHLKFPLIDLANVSIPQELSSIIPEQVARSQKVVVFERTKGGIKLAMANPNNSEFIELLSKKTNSKVIPFLATSRDIDNSLKIYRDDIKNTFDQLMAGIR